MKILILNGPNLNLLGKREPGIYGNQTFEAYFETLQKAFPNIELSYFQTNHEGDLVTVIQDADEIEVHISNTFAREDFRHNSYISPNAKGIILGFGMDSYKLAVQSFL